MTGFTSSTGTSESDVWLFSVSPEGDLIDESFYGGSLRDRMYKIHPTSDDGFILVGFTWSFGSSGNGYLIKITMDEPEPEPEPEQEEASGGIPGFPMGAIALGVMIGAVVLFAMNKPDLTL